MINKFRPKVGDTVRDGAGTRYVVKALGMRYAVVHPPAKENTTFLLNYNQMYPDNLPTVPNMIGVK